MNVVRCLAALALCSSLLSLVACEKKAAEYQATDITGADFGRTFELVDHQGNTRRLKDFHGKVTVMFFGFTHCPDVCPTTLAEFTGVMTKLGEDAERVQVLFVTVDPERDTPSVLASYVTAFDTSFIGMTGSAEQIASVAKEFKIVYQKVEGSRPGNYSVDHSAGTYIFDSLGRLRLYARYGQGSDALASDIARLLDEA